MRLQQKLVDLRSSPSEPSEDGAVLRADGRLVHAAGDARGEPARAALQTSVVALDHSRCRAERSRDSALEAWQGLVDGSWSLVERFDRDGQRFHVAHRNPRHLRDPRGLTKQQARVASLAARGFSNKVIGYYLGLSEATVATHLVAAQTKLGLRTREAIVREFSPSLARRVAEKTFGRTSPTPLEQSE